MNFNYRRKHSKLGGKRDMFELRERGDKAGQKIMQRNGTFCNVL